MAESIKIEIYRKKDAEDFTKSLADPESRAQTGSGAAMTGAVSAALLERAAKLTREELSENERVAYIVRNAEILRTYMVSLIDEDVKARGPYRRALMEKELELLEELAALCPSDARHFAAESADLAYAAIRASMRVCIYWGDLSTEDTRRYVIRRENELQLQEIDPLYKRVIEKLEA